MGFSIELIGKQLELAEIEAEQGCKRELQFGSLSWKCFEGFFMCQADTKL